MKLRTATPLVLALLAAAGLGVSAASAAQTTTQSATQSTANKKPASSSAKSSAAGGAKSSGTASKPSARKSTRKSAKRPTASSSRGKGQKAPTPERVSEIQQALAKDGSYSGSPNGKWDDNTVAAMRKYQESHGLNPSGKLDARTLQQLGLGGQTSGVAPPTPPVSSSSATTPSKTIAQQHHPQ